MSFILDNDASLGWVEGFGQALLVKCLSTKMDR